MKQTTKLVVATMLAILAVSAEAALPASATTAVASIQADMQSWFDLVFPAIILGVTLTIGPKLLKRFTGKI